MNNEDTKSGSGDADSGAADQASAKTTTTSQTSSYGTEAIRNSEDAPSDAIRLVDIPARKGK